MSDESPTEHIHEDILEKAHEARERWINWAAATAAVLAGLAAVCGTLSDSNRTNSTREQIQVRLQNVDNEPDAVWLFKE